jgi:aryl-alcohol dehydrogenase-like predicted oxidoreductase
LIAKVPLDSGWLSGRYDHTSRFDDVRSRWSPKVIERRTRYLAKVAFLRESGASLAHAALRFVLAHSAVSSVIPGARSIEQVEQNCKAAAAALDAAAVERLHALYDTELSQDPLPW